ncbi:hypothetical protein Z042_18730 [Chania multitudinisentens RB-25]|uniref:HTH lysR-type domain-containing protein n=1 Tax=Chania multitudinisentens RB-25 TaxID=1441930 RepID=W0LLL6_9GAMM|nr:LysR substrate-binding domain-containing protein [Chania multitudinisentens]AHG22910.1 hypothetical protein Z042_18730 [Chania multitudinisentens RB-25]
MIKLQKMKVFQMVVNLGSISAAAAALHLTQPALTRSLKELEASLEVDLIIRGKHGITLTGAGKIFKLRVDQIIRDIDLAINEVREVAKFRSSSISFGFSSSLTYTVLPETIKRFQDFFPKINISLVEGKLTELLPKVRRGEMDFCISIITNELLINDLTFDAFFTMPFYIVARKGHPLEKSSSIKELEGATWCLPSNVFGYQKEVESIIFLDAGEKRILRGDSGEIRLSIIMNTDYLTLAPAAIFKEPLFRENLVRINTKEKIPGALYCVMHNGEFPLSPGAQWLINEFRHSIKVYCDSWESFPSLDSGLEIPQRAT